MAEKRHNDNGQRIIDGLDEVLDWAKGNGTAHVTIPGQPGRDLTRQQYEAERERLLREMAAGVERPLVKWPLSG